MRIAVTGGMGFIGHEVVQRLLDLGHEVTVVDYWQSILGSFEQKRLPILQDLYRDLPRCSAVVEPWQFIQDFKSYSPEVTVHAGAVVDTKDLGSDDLWDKNVTYTQDLTTACSEGGSQIIFFSSAAVYGSSGYPNNPYGLTKAMGEKIVRRSRTKTASLRLFNVFGRNEGHKGPMASVPWQISRAVGAGEKFAMHSLSSRRDFVPSQTVVDVVAGLVDPSLEMSVDDEHWHASYDVGTGIPTSFSALAQMVGKTMGKSVDEFIEQIDRPADLIGRYQTYTCAGKMGVENLGGSMGTEQGIWEAYGVDK